VPTWRGCSRFCSACRRRSGFAFILVAVEGCSLAEAAALIGAAEDTVKQRVLHARRDLLARLAKASATRTAPPVEGTS
jgi:DNA-directed RNA polymerase specialized sigma24 family protein